MMGNAHANEGSNAAQGSSNAQGACRPEIVTRQEWGARPARGRIQMKETPAEVYIHHTAGATSSNKETCSKIVKSTQNYHMDERDKPFADIGYNFLVGGDGRIYEGRGWNVEGAHAVGHNKKSIGISFMGDFTKEAPSEAMMDAARDLIAYGVKEGYIKENPEIHGHRDSASTICPGDSISKTIKEWPKFKKDD